MLQFDENGNLTPYELIPATLEEVEAVFVYNKIRRRLFQEFLLFLDDLEQLELGKIEVWINGSFTTTKKYPNDIDLVIWVNPKSFSLADGFKVFFGEKFKNALDIHLEEDLPQKHRRYKEKVENEIYWKGVYGFDRKGYEKGIIKLIQF